MTVASLADHDHVAAVDEADAGDDARGGTLVVVHPGRGQRRDLEERAAFVEQRVDAVARQELAAGDVALAGALRTAGRGGGEPRAEVGHERALGGSFCSYRASVVRMALVSVGIAFVSIDIQLVAANSILG